MLLKEIVTYYGIRWYWPILLYLLAVFNRVLERFYPVFSLAAKKNVTAVSEIILDLLLKGTFIGLLFFFIPGNPDVDKTEKLKRSISLGFALHFILFS